MANLQRDVQFGLRMLARSPGFSAVAVLALALGIGANTAIFSVVYGTLLEPLPYHDPEQLVMVWSKPSPENRNSAAAGDYVDWRDQSTVFQAAFGIYGVMSFVVAQRTHEVGLRMALGASKRQVLQLVMREGMTTALVGTAIGFVGAYLVGRAMQGMWFGVAALDPVRFGAVAMVLVSAALLACYVPARRAATIDPMIALREQ